MMRYGYNVSATEVRPEGRSDFAYGLLCGLRHDLTERTEVTGDFQSAYAVKLRAQITQLRSGTRWG